MRGNKRHIIQNLAGTLLFAVGLLISCSKKNNPVGIQPPPGGTGNHAPVINSTPPSKITEDSTLTYQINASDQDGDNLSYGVNGLSGASVSNTGKVTWTAPTVSQDSTIKGVTYLASDGTDTTRQSADLTIKYVQPQKPVLDLTHIYNSNPNNKDKHSFNQDELTPSTLTNLPDTATNGDKITYTSFTDNNGYFSKASLSSNEVQLNNDKEFDTDLKGSFTFNIKDDKTGLTNSQTVNYTLFAHPNVSGTVRTNADRATPVEAVLQAGYQIKKNDFSKGNWVPLKDTLLNASNGAKILKDNKGREYFTTDATKNFNAMIKMRTDSLEKRIGTTGSLALKFGKGTVGELTYEQAKDVWGSTPPQGLVGSPYPTGSFAFTTDVSSQGVNSAALYVVGYGDTKDKDGKFAVGWNSSVGGTMNTDYTPGQFATFFGRVNTSAANGHLQGYDIKRIAVEKNHNGNSFGDSTFTQLIRFAKEGNVERKEIGEKPLELIVDSTGKYLTTRAGYSGESPVANTIVVEPVDENSNFLYNGGQHAIAATDNRFKNSQGEINGAIVYIDKNLWSDYGSTYPQIVKGVKIHEMDDLSLWAPRELTSPIKNGDKAYEESTAGPYSAYHNTSFTGIDKKGKRIVQHYKNGAFQGSFLSAEFNFEDFW